MNKTTWGQSQAPAAWAIETWDRIEQAEDWQTWLALLYARGRLGMPIFPLENRLAEVFRP